MVEEKVISKFKSRKFLFGLLGPVVAFIFETIGLPTVVTQWAIGLMATYIIGEAAVDIARVNGNKEK